MRNPVRTPYLRQTSTAAAPRPSNPGGATSTRIHALNLVFIAGAVVILFWRVFFLGETLIDVSTLNNQLPWGYYAGERSNHQYDRRDPTDMYLTRDYFVVQSYRDAELPLWNPYTMAGHPIYADGVTRIFSPSLLFYAFMDLPLGYTVARLFELGIGAIFLYCFLVGIGVRASSALFGALVFAFSSHSMLHLVGLGWWGGLMWLPLILLLVDRAITQASFAQATLAGIVLAFQVYCGYMANEIYYIGAIVLYYLILGKRRRTTVYQSGIALNSPPVVRMLSVTLIVGLSLAAPVWAPVLEQLKYSNRLIVPTQIGYIYLPPWYLATLVFPSIFGAPYDARFLTLFQAIGVSHDHTLYMGLAPLAMLGFCLFWIRRRRGRHKVPPSEASGSNSLLNSFAEGPAPLGEYFSPSFGYQRLIFFVALLVFALFIITAAPIYVHITRFIPVLQTIRVIMRAGVLFVFSASVLAGFGCQLLLDAPRALILEYFRAVRRFLYVLIAAVLACVLGAYAVKASGLQATQQGKGKLAFIRKALGLISFQFTPPNPGIIIPLLLGVLIVALLYLVGVRRLSRPGFYAAIVALLLADLFWNSRNFEHAYDRSQVYPRTSVTDLLAGLPPGRVLPTPSDIEMNRRIDGFPERSKIIAPPNTLLPYRLPTVTGKDQIFPKWYQDFATLIEPQPNMSHVVFDQSRSRFFDLIDTRYLLTHAEASPPEGMRLIETAEGVSVYQNPSALSRTFLAPGVEIVRGEAEAMSRLREPGFDPAKTVVIEEPNGSALGISEVATAPAGADSENQKSNSTATIIQDWRNMVEISTESATGGFLFLSDTYYPGWQADVDGAPARIYKADVAFRAVHVPPGRHVVTFVFAPRSFRLSLYVAGAGLLLGIVGIVLGRRPGDPGPLSQIRSS